MAEQILPILTDEEINGLAYELRSMGCSRLMELLNVAPHDVHNTLEDHDNATDRNVRILTAWIDKQCDRSDLRGILADNFKGAQLEVISRKLRTGQLSSSSDSLIRNLPSTALPDVGGLSLDRTDESGCAILWCLPRTRSTVFAKSLSGVDGISIWQAFYAYGDRVACAYLKKTGKALPWQYQGNEDIFKEAVTHFRNTWGTAMQPERVGYKEIKQNIEADPSKFVLVKDHTYSMETQESRVYIPSGFKHTFLIRDPSRLFMSLRKTTIKHLLRAGVNVDDDTFSIVTDDPLRDRHLQLFKIHFEFWQYVKNNFDADPVIIDSDDLVSNPEPILRAYCEKVGFPYTDSLLTWDASRVQTTDWKLPGDTMVKDIKEQYGPAMTSTGFIRPNEEGPIPRDQLTDDIIQCVDAAMPYYQEMYSHRLKADN